MRAQLNMGSGSTAAAAAFRQQQQQQRSHSQTEQFHPFQDVRLQTIESGGTPLAFPTAFQPSLPFGGPAHNVAFVRVGHVDDPAVQPLCRHGCWGSWRERCVHGGDRERG